MLHNDFTNHRYILQQYPNLFDDENNAWILHQSYLLQLGHLRYVYRWLTILLFLQLLLIYFIIHSFVLFSIDFSIHRLYTILHKAIQSDLHSFRAQARREDTQLWLIQSQWFAHFNSNWSFWTRNRYWKCELGYQLRFPLDKRYILTQSGKGWKIWHPRSSNKLDSNRRADVWKQRGRVGTKISAVDIQD